MKNHVTPETARKLKEAGFPQPKPEIGQFWYSANGVLFVLIAGDEGFNFCSIYGKRFGRATHLEKCFFAPTATDILWSLGQDYHIGMLGQDQHVDVLNYIFVAGLHQFGQSDLQFHENPAEACAMAYLAKNAKG